MVTSDLLEPLAAALSRLSSPATEQVAHLSRLGVADCADELALEFDDLYRPAAIELESASPEAARLCRELDGALDSDQLGWTTADLESPAWNLVRELAARALAALGRDLKGRGG